MIAHSHQFGERRDERRRRAMALWGVVGLLLLAGTSRLAAEQASAGKRGASPSAGHSTAKKASQDLTAEEQAAINAALAMTAASLPETIPVPEQSPPAPGGSSAPLASAPDASADSWIQPDCCEEGIGRRRLRFFQDRADAIGVPRSPEQSWLYRPLSVGLFVGALFGTDLVSDWVSEKGGFLGGIRAGWDFDPYWGVEVRYAMGNVELSDSARAIAQREYWHEAIPNWYYNENARYSARNLLDVSLLYYFWGDVRWRPYVLFGLGYASLRFDDALGEHWSHTTMDMPLGLGIKYLCSDQFALRFEANDTVIIGGNGLETVHDFSLTLGFEMRLGGSRRSYWPWNPGGRYW